VKSSLEYVQPKKLHGQNRGPRRLMASVHRRKRRQECNEDQPK